MAKKQPTVQKFASAAEAARHLFKQHIGLRKTIGDTAFRRFIFETLENDYDVTHSSACTMYNSAKKYWTKTEPALVEGLGRPDGKNNGGAKPRTLYVVVAGEDVISTEMSQAKASAMAEQLGDGYSIKKVEKVEA